MKKILLCIMTLLLLAGTASAQKGLHSYPVFRGKVVPTRHMVVTEVRGGNMATYKLDYYRGVTFQTDVATAGLVAGMVQADAAEALSAETETADDLLTYALVELAPMGKIHRYLCYQVKPAGPAKVVTLLYLEGSATLKDLQSMFEKQ
jgi:hypothetical protein